MTIATRIKSVVARGRYKARYDALKAAVEDLASQAKIYDDWISPEANLTAVASVLKGLQTVNQEQRKALKSIETALCELASKGPTGHGR